MPSKTKQEQVYVSKEMTIGDVVKKYPEVVETLLGYGLHCVGCHVNAFETLEQGALGHGMPQKIVDKMIKDVNEVIKNEKNGEKPDENIVTVTESAAKKIIELANKDKKPANLRLALANGGCSGFLYSMNLSPKQPGDKEFSYHGIKLFVESENFDMLKGASINYVDTLNESGFKIDNPNAKSSCGCGKSSAF